MRIEIYEKKLQNIVETEFRNNNIDTKDRIKNFIKKLKEESDVKDNLLLMIKSSIDLKDDKNEEYKTSIKNEELNKLFGDPKVILGLKKKTVTMRSKGRKVIIETMRLACIERTNSGEPKSRKNVPKYILIKGVKVSTPQKIAILRANVSVIPISTIGIRKNTNVAKMFTPLTHSIGLY